MVRLSTKSQLELSHCHCTHTIALLEDQSLLGPLSISHRSHQTYHMYADAMGLTGPEGMREKVNTHMESVKPTLQYISRTIASGRPRTQTQEPNRETDRDGATNRMRVFYTIE